MARLSTATRHKAIFFGGIEPSIRGEVWPFLLRYYSCESTSEERESLRVQKRLEYEEIQQRRLSMTPEEHKEFWRKVQFTVDKDVVRTDRSNQFFRGENNPNVEIMRRILLNYAVFNPEMGYSQGMSDLVAPILTETDYFHLFICVAIIVIYGDDVIEQQLATDQMLLHFSNLAMHMNGEIVLRKARSLLYQFRLLPRVPCSLHDLCKLCGPGMWDSRYIPAVECSGNHPGSESCPYGGTVEAPSPKQASDGKKGSKTRDIFNFRKQS
ncbi:UNVERIFIED_CONTAM: hypothetical protein FKN15_072234 [Acipenser sinensis]